MENTKLLRLKKWIAAGFLGAVSMNTLAMDETIQQLLTNIEKACPKQWEDPSVPLPHVAGNIDGNTLFQDENDRNEFSTFYVINHEVPTDSGPRVMNPAEIANALASSRAVSAECNSYRKEFFTQLITTNNADEGLALQAATGVAEALGFINNEWLAGDMRITGRANPDAGWLFPVGQTIGTLGSGADLEGDEFKALFEIAKKWAPNTGAEVWGNSGDSGRITLPDMRGRAMYAAVNMGGTSSSSVALTGGDKLGGKFGDELSEIKITNLPKHRHVNSNGGVHGHTSQNNGVHKHTMNAVAAHYHQDATGGAHGHTVAPGGRHTHSLLTSTHAGSSGAGSAYYFEGRMRPNYQNTISRSVVSAADHDHSLSTHNGHQHNPGPGGAHTPTMQNSTSHNHTINPSTSHSHTNAYVGSDTALRTVSPGMAMNIEIKY